MTDLFRIKRGLDIDRIVQIIYGNGLPGLDSDTNNAPLGSIYIDTTTGKISSKTSPGSGTNTWTEQQISAPTLDALSSISSTGLYAITGTGTSATRTIEGVDQQIVVSDGDGVLDNPTIRIASNPTLPGNEAVSVPIGTVLQRPTMPMDGMLRYNTTADKFEGYINNAWTTLIDAEDPLVQPSQILYVREVPGEGQFSSIKAAIESITDATTIKRYVVDVGAGTFIEDPFSMKPFVAVVGQSPDATIISANNPNSNFITAINDSYLARVLVTGATGSGSAAIYFQDAVEDVPTLAFFGEEIKFGANNIHVHVVSTTTRTSIYLDACRFGAAYSYDKALVCESTSGKTARVVMRNSTTTGATLPNPTLFGYASGTGAEISITGSGLRTSIGSPAGIGIHVVNGGLTQLLATRLTGYAKAIFAENVGVAPTVVGNNVQLGTNTQDLDIEHPGTLGSFSGSAAKSKVFIDPSSPMSVTYLDPEQRGTVTVGPFNIGSTHDNVTDVTDLIQQASPVGSLSGGVLTRTATPLEVSISAGHGYVVDTITMREKLITWSSTILTLPNGARNYLYINGSGVPSFAESKPDITQNILLGRASTLFGDITSVQQFQQSATAISTKIDYFLRTAIGPIFGTGCIVTEGTTPLELNVTSGTYYFSTKTYNPSGGAPISFLPFYHVAGVLTQGASTTTVSNTQYDDLTDLVSLSPGYYTKHLLILTNEGSEEIHALAYGQNEYATLLEAQNAPLPFFQIADITVFIASIIVQEGNPNVVQIDDIRPRLGFTSPGISGGVSHGDLSGLLNDDHPQYLLVDGTRSMNGSLNMGGNSITNVNLVDGTDVSNHQGRHLPNGSDPLTTAAPTTDLSPSSSNAVGIQNSFSRSDHSHAITGFQPLDSDLTAVAGLSSTGIIARTGAGTASTRAITGTAGNISATNGDGVAGNPTIDLVDTGIPGTYKSVTTDAKGRVTAGTNPTTLAGFGITDAAPIASSYITISSDGSLTNERSLAGTANQITVTDNGANSTVAISITTNPTLPGNSSVTVPIGTTAQRSGSPTTGMVRYNSDEDVLEGYSNPFSILTTPAALQRTTMYRKRRTWVDDFMTGSVAASGSAIYGDANWSITAAGTAANSAISAVTDHPGILQLGTGGTNGNTTRLHMGVVATTLVTVANQVEYFAFLIRIPTITTLTTRWGLLQDVSAANGGTAGVFFQFDPAVSANMQFITRSASVSSTAVNVVTTLVANTWYLCEAFYDGTNWTPVVNGVTGAAQTTNIPTAGVNVGILVQTNTGSSRTFQVDYAALMTTELGTRYP